MRSRYATVYASRGRVLAKLASDGTWSAGPTLPAELGAILTEQTQGLDLDDALSVVLSIGRGLRAQKAPAK